ncbi:ACP S-malonyltransferase [Streptomyces sp. NPDC057877]|uniref:ACP S-malonyltransferase n=1 Tax=Streptomyces sp. NPDC057877 TaxID=3346269 RepID=UPI0036CBF7C4
MTPRTVLMCPGQGAYLPGALRPLRDHPAVSAVLDTVDACAPAREPTSPVSALLTHPDAPAPEDLVRSHPLAFDLATYTAAVATATAVLDLLPTPADAVIGHSMGDLAALTVAGAITVRQGVRLLQIRDHLLRDAALPAAGLLVTDLTWDQATALLHDDRTPRHLAIAAHNAPAQVVLAGPTAALARIRPLLHDRGHRATPFTSRTAFHHPLLGEVHRVFRRLLQSQPVTRPRLAVHTTSTGGHQAHTPAQLRTAAAAHLTEPVTFIPALRTLHQHGYTTYVDTGPRALLSTLAKTNLPPDCHAPAPLRTPAAPARIRARLSRPATLGAALGPRAHL